MSGETSYNGHNQPHQYAAQAEQFDGWLGQGATAQSIRAEVPQVVFNFRVHRLGRDSGGPEGATAGRIYRDGHGGFELATNWFYRGDELITSL